MFGAPLYVTVLDHLRILLFSCFWTLSVFKGFCRFPSFKTLSVFKGFCHFPVSRHFPFSKVFGNRKNDQIPWKKSLFSRDLVVFPVSKNFNFSKVSGNRKNDQIPWKNDYCQGILSFLLFIDTFWIQKCLETGKTTKSLENNVFFSSRDLVVFLFLDTFKSRKCL